MGRHEPVASGLAVVTAADVGGGTSGRDIFCLDRVTCSHRRVTNQLDDCYRGLSRLPGLRIEERRLFSGGLSSSELPGGAAGGAPRQVRRHVIADLGAPP